MFVAPFGSASPGSRLVEPRYERGSREISTSLRLWSTSMSSFCQNVDFGSPPGSDTVKSVGGSPGNSSSWDVISSSSTGLAGRERIRLQAKAARDHHHILTAVV